MKKGYTKLNGKIYDFYVILWLFCIDSMQFMNFRLKSSVQNSPIISKTKKILSNE